MATALPRRIKLAFIVQTLLASLVLAAGVLAIEYGVRQMLVRERLREEAALIRALPAGAPLPHTSRLQAYREPLRPGDPPVPAGLRGLPDGLHVPLWRGHALLVERTQRGTIWVRLEMGFSNSATLWTGGLSLLLALLVTWLAAWLTYRTSKRMVVPTAWLAGVVAHWDARAPDATTLAPARLPPDSGIEVRRLAHALRGLAARVGEAMDRERLFTRDASHELRTPLTVIRGTADIMATAPDLPPRLQRPLQRILRAGHDMQSVIDAFMILARDGEMEADTERFDLVDVAAPEVMAARPLLEGRPVELHLLDHATHPVDAPRRVVAIIIGHLLANAVRFTESGRIDVVLRDDRIEVRDTGIGMTDDALAQAFDPFYRHDRDRDGMGMGLAVVRRLAERLDWRVELQSAPGAGTVATVLMQRG